MWFDDFLQDDPLYSLDEALAYAEGEYRDALLRFWGLPPHEEPIPEGLTEEEQREYTRLYELAHSLAQGTKGLIRPQDVRSEDIKGQEFVKLEAEVEDRTREDLFEMTSKAVPPENRERWREFITNVWEPADPRMKNEFINQCFQLEAAELFGIWIGGIGSRMRKLISRFVEERGEFTRAYLSRVAECYVRGMSTELAVMARAVVEKAIEEKLSDEAAAVELGKKPGSRINLFDRIQACRLKGWFGEAEEEVAHRIRLAGNDAVHATPGLVGDLDELLDDLVCVLKALE